jgi:polysaccharide chain length determinant protein (PEP-CTERM system associated)
LIHNNSVAHGFDIASRGIGLAEELDEPVFLSWEEYWAIAVRRRWWILLPLFLGWAAVWGASWFLPVTYQSESLILVEQQKVPDQYVVPNVTSDLQRRLQSLTEQILSRTRLQATIDRLHLYSRSGGGLNSGDPVEQMRNDIKIELVSAPDHPGEYTAFKMRYSAASPELAQKVNGELSSLFIAENINTQRQLSENTTAFLESQLADARANMAEQEAKVAAFKEKHLGELPSQLESNMQILSGLQSQLQSAQQTLDAAKQQKLYLESLLQQYQSVQASMVGGGSAAESPQTLETMRLKLQDLQSRYTAEHPDIIALKEKIAQAEQLKKQAESQMAAIQKDGKPGNAVDPAAAVEMQHGSPTPIMQVQSQLKANQLEISNIQQHERDLESQITGYQARLNLTPETEQQLTAISRGYEESKTNYNSLLQKQMQSQLATSLEQRQQGEQFRIVDPPSLPKKPSAPNHLWFSLGGLLVGISLGLGLTALLEMTDVRVRQEKDLVGIIPVSVLVGIPHLSTPGETHSRVVRWWKELGAAAALVVLIILGNLYAFIKG